MMVVQTMSPGRTCSFLVGLGLGLSHDSAHICYCTTYVIKGITRCGYCDVTLHCHIEMEPAGANYTI